MSDNEASSSTTTIPSSYTGMKRMVASSASSPSAGGYAQVDAARELGLDLEARQYNTRLMALTKPADYAAARQTEFDKMVSGVKKVYERSYAGFTSAGMPHDMARNYALAAANTEKQVRKQILETLYPSGANVIGDASMVRNMTGSVANLAGVGGTSLSGRRRATTRKRAAPRRRR